MAKTDEAALRREMVDTARRMNASGINQGTAGNLSVRCADGFLITPSSLPYDVDEAGRHREDGLRRHL